LEENMLPFGFVHSGAEIETFVDSDGDRWFGNDH
jgi:hypothetical protein